MAYEILKNIYNPPFSKLFGTALQKVVPNISIDQLQAEIYQDNWQELSLKQRMRHISHILHKYLDSDFAVSSQQILNLIGHINTSDYKYPALVYNFIPHFISQYGLDHFTLSMACFEQITSFSTCEFAVRPFLEKESEKTFEQLLKWSKHKNFHVRRLASECCRPKLPWAMVLKDLQKDPSPILPILENLKNDTEDYVYRSVANNLNDISKDHPKLVLSICEKWNHESKTVDWVIKHALRTQLKLGNQEAMKLFGYGSLNNFKVSDFQIFNKKVKIGDYLHFSFKLENKQKALNRIEYAIYFRKLNGQLSKKVFKISEKTMLKNTTVGIEKKHNFKVISTRKYHTGIHQLSIIINGFEQNILNFNLL